MKVVRNLCIFLLLAWYVSGPYRTANKFEAALQARDYDTVANMIDAEGLKDSLKEFFIESTVKMASVKAGGSFNEEQLRQQIRNMFEQGPIANQLDHEMKPDKLAKMFVTAAKWDTNKGKSPVQRWVSPISFSVQASDSETKAIFKFKGLGWKISGLEIPMSEIQRAIPGLAM